MDNQESIIIIAIIFILLAIWAYKTDKDNDKSAIDKIIDKDNLEIKAALVIKLKEYKQEIEEKEQCMKELADECIHLKKSLDKAVLDVFLDGTEINNLKEKVSQLSQLNQSLQKELISYKTATPKILVKQCPACKRVQPVSEFGRNENQPDGLTKWCSICMTEGAPMPHDMSGMKVCEKCGQNRKKSSFYPSSRYADGLSKWCKFCLDSRK